MAKLQELCWFGREVSRKQMCVGHSFCTPGQEAPPSSLTCVWDETLQVGPGSLVLQQLLGRQVCEEHLEDSLSVLTVPGVGVPHHTEAQERL